MIPVQNFSLNKRRRYPLVFVLAVVVLVALIWFFVPPGRQHEFFMPAVASSAGLAYFLYSQHLQETKLFTDLFRQFNERYDKLNEHLNRIALTDEQQILGPEDKQTLFDYFNLCAEEFLYFKTGFIDAEVWSSWLRGMRYFASIRQIKDLWASELQGGSYYGFTIELLHGNP